MICNTNMFTGFYMLLGSPEIYFRKDFKFSLVQVPVGVHLPHLYSKILIVALGLLVFPLDGLSCSLKKILVAWVILSLLWKIMGEIWAKTTKIHISGTAHSTDLVDP